LKFFADSAPMGKILFTILFAELWKTTLILLAEEAVIASTNKTLIPGTNYSEGN